MNPTIEERFPDSVRIHLPVEWCFGFILDRRMPVGQTWPEGSAEAQDSGRQLIHPFLIIENDAGGCVEISSRSPDRLDGHDSLGISTPSMVRYGRPRVRVERTADGFTVRFQSGTDQAPEIREIPSIDDAVESHHQWLGANYRLRSIDSQVADGDLPSWAFRIPLVIVFDMWLTNHEVAHNYRHLTNMCHDLSQIGVPEGTVIYIPGWCGPYDGGYPHYEPVPELGGKHAFRGAMEAAHDAGFVVMVHTLGWGADPYRPEYEGHSALAVRNWDNPADPPPPIVHRFQGKLPPDGSPLQPESDDPLRGPYTGWPGGGEYLRLEWAPMQFSIDDVRRSVGGWLFDVAGIRERCEAVVAVGGLKDVGQGVVKLTVGGRSLTSPAGHFTGHDSYSFPFTFLLEPGVNPVELVVYGATENANGKGEGSEAALSEAWLRIEEAWGHGTTHNVWTQPAVGMDLNNPDWHEAFCEKLVPTVTDFGVDLVHIDATTLWRWDEGGMYGTLRRLMPRLTAFGTEVGTVPGLKFFLLHQTNPDFLYRAAGANQAASAWRPEFTDLSWQITGRYGHFYGGLCEPEAFVPHRCVCTVDPKPASLTEGHTEQVRRLLLLQAEHHMVPAIRVNYRDYGVDELTRHYLQEHIVECEE